MGKLWLNHGFAKKDGLLAWGGTDFMASSAGFRVIAFQPPGRFAGLHFEINCILTSENIKLINPMPEITMEPLFFPAPSDFRKWLEANHDKADELWVGYYKKATGIPSIDWNESVDEGLCFGWIDGIRKSLDNLRYTIRFTPRRPGSIWSGKNIKRYLELEEAGYVMPAGKAAYGRRKEDRSERYAYEQGKVSLSAEYEKQIKANPKAWEFFQNLPASVKKPTVWWVMSAKRADTRQRRLETLIQCSEEGQRIPQLRREA
jgi:uncharacterized protein YdeI (YjbR/CyaY-like superfamily)